MRKGRRDFSHGLTEAKNTVFFIVVWVKVHDILGYFCILKGAYHSLPFSNTQEGEP